MNAAARRRYAHTAVCVMLSVSFATSAGRAAERKSTRSAAEQLIGTWTLVSVDNVRPNGTRTPRHGAHPSGLLTFSAEGFYSLIVLTEGTPEEYKAALEGNNCDFGRYTVTEQDQSVTFYMDHASHQELEGSSHTRFFVVKGSQLVYTTLKPGVGGKFAATYGEVVLERARPAVAR